MRIAAHDRERDEVHQPEKREDRKRGAALAAAGATIEKRDQHQEERDEPKCDNAKPFTFESRNVTRKELERVERGEEIPFGTDARGNRRERIRFLAKLPWIECG